MPGGTPTIKDVAERAGVSVTTVTNVLHGRGGRFSEETRERVMQAVEELGYRPNQIARSLVRRRSHTLGVVVEHFRGALLGNPYYSTLLDGILAEAVRSGYQLKIIALERPDPSHARLSIEDGSVDGAILAAPLYGSPLLRWFEECHIPRVVAGSSPHDLRAACVDVDDEGSVYAAVQWLIRLGHRRIAFIGGPTNYWSAQQRERGYLRALHDAGITPTSHWIRRGNYSTLSGRQAMEKLLQVRPAFSAVVCCNDWMALGALEVLRRQGVLVPDDISVLGFDDVEAAAVASPPLTTIRQPVREIGIASAQLLIRQIESGQPATERVIFPGELVQRDSVMPYSAEPSDRAKPLRRLRSRRRRR
ncbi:MAG: LacI family DNA-binding transcriptional regulator [Armatimonadota bacterium]|nr:LacI family DNA-binding transcriptional regulator [Armatimonadota bacterium]MDW8289848.1 LacI family DNA-binding transcriptional regulator [Armatimonadota bacterium]